MSKNPPKTQQNNNGQCSCANGYSELKFDNTMLCKQDNQLSNCNEVEVFDTIADDLICYTNTTDLDIMKTLSDACVSGFRRTDFDDNSGFLTACINECHGATLNLLHDRMFENACEEIGGYPAGSDGGDTGNYYCAYCTVPNTIAKNLNTCECKSGYTDANSDMSDGCEATSQQ